MAVGQRRHSELLRGVLDLCLLSVIEDEPAYGYEMTKRLRARGLTSVGQGSIYPLLARLERDGLVETYRGESDDGPPRKYFRATRAGRRMLKQGVAEWNATRDDIDAVLNPQHSEVRSRERVR